MAEENTEAEQDMPEEAAATDEADQVIGEETSAEAGDEEIGAAPDDVQAPEYEDLSEVIPPGEGQHPSLDIVLDVPVTVSLEVGKATMKVGELIKLGQGAVVELDRAVGEPLDVMVNGALVAHGEIVLVNEKFGIRLTSVVQPTGAAKKKEAS